MHATQRAYTLRLRGIDRKDQSWREKLWQTHLAVNKGVIAFGNWLLTFRGGVDYQLADANSVKSQGEIAQRRIFLALSWLSVESRAGAPEKYIIDTDDKGKWKTVQALREILQHRGASDGDIEDWINDCSVALNAAIRKDAVWVNRSKAFDDALKTIGRSLNREVIWDLLGRFFGSTEAYLKPADSGADGRVKEFEEAREMVLAAGTWLSKRFGTGLGADFKKLSRIYKSIERWCAVESRKRHRPYLTELAAELGVEKHDEILKLLSKSGESSGTQKVLNKHKDVPLTLEALKLLRMKAGQDAKKCMQQIGDKGRRPWSNKMLAKVQKSCGIILHPGNLSS
ncbi:MAG: hypothetical protein B0D92_08095 [Spirochaeta sp. LUC14_002_19_P3]|nr:MAG: hypothetical protein B0D92_08095 [Spirochaeta sp. LUC14_002_19_P3]